MRFGPLGFLQPWLIAGLILLIASVCLRQACAADSSAEADRAWQAILQQATAPEARFRTPEEANTAARQRLDAQETSLAGFEKSFPDDPRRFSAHIRHAATLASKARLTHQPTLRAQADRMLADLEADPAMPAPVKADAAFARVSQTMLDAAGRTDAATRDGLLKTVRQFDDAYPADRRIPALLAEVATLYDGQPAQKKALLEDAAGRTPDEGTRQRIGDDLKRLALLGQPLNLRLVPWQGEPAIDLAEKRGRVVVLLFWASWSLPSLNELARLEQLAPQFAGQPVEFVTVSLDEDRAALAATIRVADLRWPVHCDGQGWRGEMVRSLGLNALPTTWVLNRRGVLLTLNARERAAEIIRQALAEPAAVRP